MSKSFGEEKNKDEIDFFKLFLTVFGYKISIAICISVSLLAAFIFYKITPKVYEASTTVEVGEMSSKNNPLALFNLDSSNDSELTTEIQIIKSRFLISKAFSGAKCFPQQLIKSNYFLSFDTYGDEPYLFDDLQIMSKKAHNYQFTLTPLKDDHFELKVLRARPFPMSIIGKKVFHTKVYSFGEQVDLPFLKFKVKNNNSSIEPQTTYIRFFSNEQLVERSRSEVRIFETGKQSRVIRISYRDMSQKRAQDVLNSIAAEYVKESTKRKKLEASYRLVFIDSQLLHLKEELNTSEDNLNEFKKANSFFDLSQSATILIDKQVDADRNINELQNLLHVVKGNLDALKVSQYSCDQMDELLIFSSPGIQEAIAPTNNALRAAEIERSLYPQAHPERAKYQAKIDALRMSLRSELEGITTTILERLEVMTNNKVNLDTELASYPDKEKSLARLMRAFLVNEKVYSYLLEKRAEAAIVKAATLSNNRILDIALLPSGPVQPILKFYLGAGLFIGLFIGLGQVYFREVLRSDICSLETLSQSDSCLLLGVIPYLKPLNEDTDNINEMDPSFAHLSKVTSTFGEAFRYLRTNVQIFLKQHALDNKDKGLIISITSTIPAEGKTTVSSHLAASIALQNKKVCLITLDLRRGRLHYLFRIEQNIGLSNYLASDSEMYQSVVTESGIENLSIITSGSVPPNPAELIQSEKMQELLEQLKNDFDFIVVDTPPLGVVSDSLIFLKDVDICLFVLKENYSKRSFIEAAKALENEGKVKNLGFVLNSVVPRKNGRYNYYGQYSGYYYYGGASSYYGDGGYYSDDK